MKMDKNKLIMIGLGCFTIIAVCAIVFTNTSNVSDAFNPQFEEDQFREQAVSGVSEEIKILGYSTISGFSGAARNIYVYDAHSTSGSTTSVTINSTYSFKPDGLLIQCRDLFRLI